MLAEGGAQIGAIGFRMGARAGAVAGLRQDLIFSLGVNSYMGTERVQAELKALANVSPGPRSRSFHKALSEITFAILTDCCIILALIQRSRAT